MMIVTRPMFSSMQRKSFGNMPLPDRPQAWSAWGEWWSILILRDCPARVHAFSTSSQRGLGIAPNYAGRGGVLNALVEAGLLEAPAATARRSARATNMC